MAVHLLLERINGTSSSLRGLVAIALLALSGCVSEEVRIVDLTPPDQYEGEQDEALLLDIGIAVFDANVPEDYDERIERLIQPEVRRAEVNFMPYVTKNLLQSTGNWGAVRVIPRPSDAVDVVVGGKILHSDGEALRVQVEVRDATGRQWFQRDYETLASKYAYGDTLPADVDPFQGFYRELADDMLAYRETLSDDDLREIRTVAEMRFARSFAPDAFGDHLAETDGGRLELSRLPADDDPNLARVRKIREREYLFIDTLDEYYDTFYRNMYTPYNNWRKASYDEAIAYRQLRTEARRRTIGGALAIAGGVAAIYEGDNAMVDAAGIGTVIGGAMTIKSAIGKRAEAAIHAEVLQELGVAAEAEVVPHTLELENQTVRLQGTVDEQYAELRSLLRRLYYEDFDLPVPDE